MAAITGPATLGHWDRQRCGSWTTFYATIVKRRTAATLGFFFFMVSFFVGGSCVGSASSWVTGVAGRHLENNGHAPVSPVPLQVCERRPAAGALQVSESTCETSPRGRLAFSLFFFLFINFNTV